MPNAICPDTGKPMPQICVTTPTSLRRKIRLAAAIKDISVNKMLTELFVREYGHIVTPEERRRKKEQKEGGSA